jgi:hypothetical protein
MHPIYASGIHLDSFDSAFPVEEKSVFANVAYHNTLHNFFFVLFFSAFKVSFYSMAQHGSRLSPSSAFHHSSWTAGAYFLSFWTWQSGNAGFLSQVIYPRGQQRGQRFICTFAIEGFVLG